MLVSRLICRAALIACAAVLHARFSAQPLDLAARALDRAASVRALLLEIEATNPEDVQKDPAGDIISVVLRQGRANDHNLALVSTLGSVRRLALGPTRTAQPSPVGSESLTNLTNLVSLHVACSGSLPKGVFPAMCALKQLRDLNLCFACPPLGEYRAITNLQNLTELHVTYCTNFTDAQLALLASLPHLSTVELKYNALSSHATNILSGMGALTNISFVADMP
jgi:hypothetical protein